MVNHSGHLPLKKLHSTDETVVWRPWGILSQFTTRCEITLSESAIYVTYKRVCCVCPCVCACERVTETERNSKMKKINITE